MAHTLVLIKLPLTCVWIKLSFDSCHSTIKALACCSVMVYDQLGRQILPQTTYEWQPHLQLIWWEDKIHTGIGCSIKTLFPGLEMISFPSMNWKHGTWCVSFNLVLTWYGPNDICLCMYSYNLQFSLGLWDSYAIAAIHFWMVGRPVCETVADGSKQRNIRSYKYI